MSLEELFGAGNPQGPGGNDAQTVDRPNDPLGSLFSGGPLLDRTASDNWRSNFTTPAYVQSNVKSPYTPGEEETATPKDTSGGFFGGVGRAIGGAANWFSDTFAPDSPNNVFQRMGQGFGEGAKMALAPVPSSWEDLKQQGPGGALAALFAPISALTMGALGAGNAITQDPHSEAFRQNLTGATDVLTGGSIGAFPEASAERAGAADVGRASARDIVSPMEGPRALSEPARPLALPAPADRLALPAPRPDTAIPMPEGERLPVAMGAGRGDAAAIEAEQNNILLKAIADRQAAQEAEAARNVTGGTLQSRGITDLTPVSRGDLTLPKTVAPEPALDVASRTAPTRPALGTPPAGPLGEAMVTRGGSRLEQAAARGETWVTPEMLAKNEANQNLKSAIHSGDAAAARSALTELEQRGASAKNTVREMRAAGLNVPTKAITFTDLRESLTGMRPPTTAATLAVDLEKSTKAVAANKTGAGDTILFRQEAPSGRPTLIGTNEFRPEMIGSREVAQSDEAWNSYVNSHQANNTAFKMGDTTVVVPNERQSAQMFSDGPIAETRFIDGKPVIYVKQGLERGKFVETMVHELEHVGQLKGGMNPAAQLSMMERRAYATHGEGINSMADQYVRDNQYPAEMRQTQVPQAPSVQPMAPGELSARMQAAKAKLGLKMTDETADRPLTREDLARIRDQRRTAGQDIGTSFDRTVGDTGKAQPKTSPQGPNINSKDSGEQMAALRQKGYIAGPLHPDEQAYYDRTGTRPVQGESSSPTPPRRSQEPPGPTYAATSPSGNSQGPVPDRVPYVAPKDNGVLRGVERATGALKTTEISGSPLHFAGRHTSGFMLSHPLAWLQGLKGGAEGALRTAATADERLATMRKNVAANGFDPDRLFSRPHYGIVGGEEQDAAGVLSRMGGPLTAFVNRSGTGFTMGINETRYQALKGAMNFPVWLQSHGINAVRTVNAGDKAALADTIRTFSGKGFVLDPRNAEGWQKALARVANVALFAPQYAAARVKMLGELSMGLKGLVADAGRARPLNPVDVERVRLGLGQVASTAAWIGLMKNIGIPVNTDWTSSNFLRADLGAPSQQNGIITAVGSQLGFSSTTQYNSDGSAHVMLDIGGPEASMIRAISQTVHNFSTSARNIDGSPKGLAPITNFALNQLGPPFYQVAKFIQGRQQDFVTMFAPMWLGEGLENSGDVHFPTFMWGAAKPFKGEPSPDIVVGPTPAPAQRSGAGSTAKPGATPRPAPTRKIATK